MSYLSQNLFSLSKGVLLLALCAAFSLTAHASEPSERFALLEWVWAKKKKKLFETPEWNGEEKRPARDKDPELTLVVFRENGEMSRSLDDTNTEQVFENQSFTRAHAKFLVNSLFTAGNKNFSYNFDLGFEAFKESNESGFGFLFRPIGRSSQDTNVLLKVGHIHSRGHGVYLGGEAKVYLLSFFGIQADYTYAPNLEWNSGKLILARIRYETFLEVSALHIGAYISTHESLFIPPNQGTKVKETLPLKGVTLSLIL